MNVIDKKEEAAIVELQGVVDVQAGVKGNGMLKKVKKAKNSKKEDDSEIDKALYIQKASKEELRSCFSPREAQEIVANDSPLPSIKAQIVASPRHSQSEQGSENTERLPTDSAINKTIDKTKELDKSSFYYNGSSGAKTRPLYH